VLKGQQVTETVAASRVDDSELKRERWRHEKRLKELELKVICAQMERDAKRAELRKTVLIDDDDEAAQLKRYVQALTHILAPQPDEVTDTLGWFKGVENQFHKLSVTPEFRSRLIYKYLLTRFRALCSRLSSDIRDDFDKIKEAILKDLGLSAKTFLERFNRVKKRPSDTFTLYESRLTALLKQYLSSRKVETLTY